MQIISALPIIVNTYRIIFFVVKFEFFAHTQKKAENIGIVSCDVKTNY